MQTQKPIGKVKSNRDLLRPTPLATLQATSEKDDALSRSKSWGNNLKIEEGKNKFRLFPKHPDSPEDQAFYVMKGVHWVPLEGADDKMGRYPVFNGRIHGGVEKDIIEEYITYCQNNVDNDDQKKILTDFRQGIGLSTVYAAYALKITSIATPTGKKEQKQFGIWEFYKTVRDGINSAAQIEDSEEPIVIDPFTDPDTGRCVFVEYKAKPKAKYSVKLGDVARKLSDEEIEEFLRATPLNEICGDNVYKKSDWDRAINGLQNFDSENEIGVFESEEFQEIVQACFDQFNWDKKKEKTGGKTVAKVVNTKKSTAVEEEQEEEIEEEATEEMESEADQFDQMDRKALIKFNAENSLELKIFKTMDDETIRSLVRDKYSELFGQAEEAVEEEEAEEEAEQEEDEVVIEDEVEEEEQPKPIVRKGVSKTVVSKPTATTASPTGGKKLDVASVKDMLKKKLGGK